jgi:aminodeoxyfutalosine synthase
MVCYNKMIFKSLHYCIFVQNISGMNTTEQVEKILADTSLSTELQNIAHKVFNKERITFDEGVYLYEHAELGYLGVLANFIREEKHGDTTYFNRNFHLEPTNLCVYDCKFCSYSRLIKQKKKAGL